MKHTIEEFIKKGFKSSEFEFEIDEDGAECECCNQRADWYRENDVWLCDIWLCNNCKEKMKEMEMK